jgi:DNA-binding transcriptional regulator YiaG
MSTSNAWAERIREARSRAGLSQDRFAERLGTTRQIVIGWEKGRHRPSPRFRQKIVEVTGDKSLFDEEVPGR